MMSFDKMNSYCDLYELTPTDCLLETVVMVEGASKIGKIIWQWKLFNHQKKLIRKFLATW